jgi:serine/threonine protein kinase
MDVLEYSEDFGGPEDDFAFKQTTIVYEIAGSIYRAYSRKRYISKNEIQFGDMFSTNKIQGALIFPEFKDTFTKAEGSPGHLSSLYLKKPSLSPYTPNYPGLIRETWIEEVKTCEILKKNPHPNIAQYHGCAVVNDGSIRGIYFTKYDQTLMDKVNPARRNKIDFACERRDADRSKVDGWLKGIELGLKHLHGLGIIHNDINPCNIMFQGENPVIIDFDSSRAQGHDLRLVKRTHGWHDEMIKVSLPSNDTDALREIKLWLLGDVSQFQY